MRAQRKHQRNYNSAQDFYIRYVLWMAAWWFDAFIQRDLLAERKGVKVHKK